MLPKLTFENIFKHQTFSTIWNTITIMPHVHILFLSRDLHKISDGFYLNHRFDIRHWMFN